MSKKEKREFWAQKAMVEFASQREAKEIQETSFLNLKRAKKLAIRKFVRIKRREGKFYDCIEIRNSLSVMDHLIVDYCDDIRVYCHDCEEVLTLDPHSQYRLDAKSFFSACEELTSFQEEK